MALRPRFLWLLLLAACGLVPADPIGFRTYPLERTTYAEAATVVQDVTRKFALSHWGGLGITWDPQTRNLTVDPVYRGHQRMRLYLHLEPAGNDVNVEMFALVETLQSDAAKIGWVEPMQDVPLEQELFDAFVAELVARRGGTP
jgi:hypothetical protein